METFEAPDGYAPLKIRRGIALPPRKLIVRRMTLDEIKALDSHAKFLANDGTVRDVKINGKVRTWKRDPNRVEVPVKYGLYEYGRFDTAEALRRFVVIVVG